MTPNQRSVEDIAAGLTKAQRELLEDLCRCPGLFAGQYVYDGAGIEHLPSELWDNTYPSTIYALMGLGKAYPTDLGQEVAHILGDAGKVAGRGFPILLHWKVRKVSGPRLIPWAVIAPHEHQATRNHGQTLERLAERGGLDWCEAAAVLEDRKWHAMDADEAEATVMRHVGAILQEQAK